ncbi:Calcium-binding EF-hand [Cynara cardunculus var. scolymus]|uniref:Calcium-binding EF-hand n=2 Tax=Cynara cardunculus var. scolymus TaxID=59895 RepID=A0A103YAH1_CYNCS|nr:Calcium-binding EF-hand [Cynara cardunculus var. scolymus]
MNDCQLLLNSLQVPIRSILTHVSIPWNKLRATPVSLHDHVKESTTIKKDSLFFSLGEINMVMNELGFQKSCCNHDHSSRIDITSLFDDDEPSLGEVKVAFDVFDENSDGFIDEFELQKMLCRFGQPEEVAKLEQCRNMIKGFDVNGDGVIDFEEFVKLMETCCF